MEMIKKSEMCLIRDKDCECCLGYTNVKDVLILYKCLCCNRNYQKNFDENLRRALLTYKFSGHDINKFILLLRKGV